jgi:hypothetical protein
MHPQPEAVSPVGIFPNAASDRFKLVGGIVNVGEKPVVVFDRDGAIERLKNS